MYCPQCGTEAEEGARFCAKCGRDVSNSSEQPHPAPETREAGEYDPNYRTEDRPHVPNYLMEAILSTIFCYLPTGIVSIVYAAQVNGLVAAGDFTRARQASEKANTWVWVTFGLGILAFLGIPISFFTILMLAAP